MLAKHDKMRGHEENNTLLSFYVPQFQSTVDGNVLSQLNAKHDNGTRFRQHRQLTRLVSQCTHVLYHKTHIRDLN